MASKEQQVEVILSSDDSSSVDTDNDVSMEEPEQLNDDPEIDLADAGNTAWLTKKAKSYQESMKLIPVPTNRGSVIPYTSWMGLGRSLKQMYNQPLHYLTNVQLKRMDQQRHGAVDEYVQLDTIIHPVKAEAIIWIMEEVHRSTTSSRYLLQLWEADLKYHAFIDPFVHMLEKKE